MRRRVRTLVLYSPAIVLVVLAIAVILTGLLYAPHPTCTCPSGPQPACSCPALSPGPLIWSPTAVLLLGCAALYVLVLTLLRLYRRPAVPTPT
jgi:hypothetical protein